MLVYDLTNLTPWLPVYK